MRLIRTSSRSSAPILASLIQRGNQSLQTVQPAVKKIVSDVRKQGDSALLRYARRFDKLAAKANLRIDPEEAALAWASSVA